MSEQHLERSAERIEKVADRTYPLLRLMAFGMVILLVVIIGLAIIMQRANQDREQNTAEIQEILTHVRQDVDHLEQFVEDLEASQGSAERQAASEATQRAIALVPVILAVLCEANPEVPSCNP